MCVWLFSVIHLFSHWFKKSDCSSTLRKDTWVWFSAPCPICCITKRNSFSFKFNKQKLECRNWTVIDAKESLFSSQTICQRINIYEQIAINDSPTSNKMISLKFTLVCSGLQYERKTHKFSYFPCTICVAVIERLIPRPSDTNFNSAHLYIRIWLFPYTLHFIYRHETSSIRITLDIQLCI